MLGATILVALAFFVATVSTQYIPGYRRVCFDTESITTRRTAFSPELDKTVLIYSPTEFVEEKCVSFKPRGYQLPPSYVCRQMQKLVWAKIVVKVGDVIPSLENCVDIGLPGLRACWGFVQVNGPCLLWTSAD